MIWKDWSEETRAQFANAVVTVFLAIFAVVLWRQGADLMAKLCALGVVVNVVGAVSMRIRARRQKEPGD